MNGFWNWIQGRSKTAAESVVMSQWAILAFRLEVV